MNTGVTVDPTDPRLGHGADDVPRAQNDVYLVLSAEEVARGYLQPYRESYTHLTCGRVTRMGPAIAATYAREPWFYGSTYCVGCAMHRPLKEFQWVDSGQPPRYQRQSLDPAHWSEEVMQEVQQRKAALKV